MSLPSPFHVNDHARFAHPAGPVYGTIVKVESRSVCLEVKRHGGLEPIDLWFTLRADGTYRQAGKGPKSPQLVKV